MSEWFKTPLAAAKLGCSGDYLKGQRDIKNGPLEAGIHYQPGISVSAPIMWNIEAVREAFLKKGLCNEQARIADRIRRQLVEA